MSESAWTVLLSIGAVAVVFLVIIFLVGLKARRERRVKENRLAKLLEKQRTRNFLLELASRFANYPEGFLRPEHFMSLLVYEDMLYIFTADKQTEDRILDIKADLRLKKFGFSPPVMRHDHMELDTELEKLETLLRGKLSGRIVRLVSGGDKDFQQEITELQRELQVA